MANELSPEEQAIVNEVLKRIKSRDRQLIPSKRIKQFLQAVGDELKRTGDLTKESVDRFVAQAKVGDL
jgi:hypothetical protein